MGPRGTSTLCTNAAPHNYASLGALICRFSENIMLYAGHLFDAYNKQLSNKYRITIEEIAFVICYRLRTGASMQVAMSVAYLYHAFAIN